MKRLGVNIDHVATLRNARGEKHPDPLNAAKKVIRYGGDSVTIHAWIISQLLIYLDEGF